MAMNAIKLRDVIVISALAAVPVIVLADKLDVKPGLWETTTTTEIGGMNAPAMPAVPPEVLAKMPPEQRARMEAMLNSRNSGNGMTTQSCVTEKDLERGLRPETNKDQSCKIDSISIHGKTQEAHVTCTGSRGTSTGVFKMTAISREAYEGTMDMNTAVNGRSMTVKLQMKGKWLGADCGAVKPIER